MLEILLMSALLSPIVTCGLYVFLDGATLTPLRKARHRA